LSTGVCRITSGPIVKERTALFGPACDPLLARARQK